MCFNETTVMVLSTVCQLSVSLVLTGFPCVPAMLFSPTCVRASHVVTKATTFHPSHLRKGRKCAVLNCSIGIASCKENNFLWGFRTVASRGSCNTKERWRANVSQLCLTKTFLEERHGEYEVLRWTRRWNSSRQAKTACLVAICHYINISGLSQYLSSVHKKRKATECNISAWSIQRRKHWYVRMIWGCTLLATVSRMWWDVLPPIPFATSPRAVVCATASKFGEVSAGIKNVRIHSRVEAASGGWYGMALNRRLSAANASRAFFRCEGAKLNRGYGARPFHGLYWDTGMSTVLPSENFLHHGLRTTVKSHFYKIEKKKIAHFEGIKKTMSKLLLRHHAFIYWMNQQMLFLFCTKAVWQL